MTVEERRQLEEKEKIMSNQINNALATQRVIMRQKDTTPIPPFKPVDIYTYNK